MAEDSINVTPPIRSIAAEDIEFDLKSIELKFRERSTSSSSTSSSCSSSSISQPADNDSDDDDYEDFFPPLTIMRRDSLSSVEEIPISACQVCLDESPIQPLSCCSSTICSICLHSHLSTHITEAKIRISCPACSHIFTRDEILLVLIEHNELAERYKRFYADINNEPHIKTCPQCCAIKEIDKKLVEGIRWKKTIPRHVTCDECQFNWCFYCHAPWHDKMSCKEYQEGEKMLRLWASKMDNNQHNAQQCPRCKVFISRNGGCPHMICSKCHCDFCYNCGKRRYGIKLLGSHESRFSPFGCKYNLYPDKPILRRTVRGLVAGAATLAAPVAAVGAVAILAVGTTIAAPTYGTFRLIRHIRNKRRARHHRSDTRRTTSSEDTIDNDEADDDIQQAIQASLVTLKQDEERRMESAVDNDSNSREEN